MDPAQAVLYSNRAACQLALKDWRAAVQDATRSVELEPALVKAWYRLSVAWLELGEAATAASVLARGLKAVGDDDKGILRRQLKRVKATMAPSRQGGNRGGLALGGDQGLYPDRPGADASEAQRVLERLRRAVGADGAASSPGVSAEAFNGVFKSLMDKGTFQRMIYPGLTEEQRQQAPASFQELLEAPAYAEALQTFAVPAALERARSVLSNVKAKGRAAGDEMDANTEAALWPQIVNEALAREIVSLVRRLHMVQHAMAASDPANLASPDADEASWGQLPAELIQQVGDAKRGFGLVDDFMGSDWLPVVTEDAERFAEKTTLQPVPVPERTAPGSLGEMRWIENDEALKHDFPALSELLANLHALPYEWNAADPSLRLCKALPASTMLLRLGPGTYLPPRLDSGRPNGPNDTGFALSVVYCLGPARCSSTSGGVLTLRHVQGQEIAEVQPWGDRLVVWRSTDVSNERSLVPPGQSHLCVAFWIHGVRRSAGVDASAEQPGTLSDENTRSVA